MRECASNTRASVSANASVSVSGRDDLTAGSHFGSKCTVQSLLGDEQMKGQQWMKWCIYFTISSQ